MGQRKDPTPSVHSLSSGLSMCFLCKIIPKLLKIKSVKVIKTLLLQICLQKWHPSIDTIFSHYPLKSILCCNYCEIFLRLQMNFNPKLSLCFYTNTVRTVEVSCKRWLGSLTVSLESPKISDLVKWSINI